MTWKFSFLCLERLNPYNIYSTLQNLKCSSICFVTVNLSTTYKRCSTRVFMSTNSTSLQQKLTNFSTQDEKMWTPYLQEQENSKKYSQREWSQLTTNSANKSNQLQSMLRIAPKVWPSLQEFRNLCIRYQKRNLAKCSSLIWNKWFVTSY